MTKKPKPLTINHTFDKFVAKIAEDETGLFVEMDEARAGWSSMSCRILTTPRQMRTLAQWLGSAADYIDSKCSKP